MELTATPPLYVDFDPKYLMEHYQKDITGYNVAQCVHVEAAWSGDPVGETK